MTPTIGKKLDGHDLKLDLGRLVETRMLVQANSGGGKSWLLRRILEQTHGRVQQIVLDVEGEFHTLRERFDYVLARPSEGDCVAHPKTAKLLAHKLLELSVSAIVDIYELKAHERHSFAKLFLDALVNAPKSLWRPALIVVDEAHMFCPQVGSAESAGAVIDLMTRGRKRGFCGILATQRISKLHKDAAAEANNKLIGRSALDIDMKRAADELGLSGRDDVLRLRTLEDGHFFAFGPALSMSVTEVKVGPVTTTHPRPGQRAVPTPAPSEKVRAALAKLADLPKEAEEEVRTVETLRRTVGELRRELAQAQRAQPIDPAAVEQARADGFQQGYRQGDHDATKRLRAGVEALFSGAREAAVPAAPTARHAPAAPARPQRQSIAAAAPPQRRASPAPNGHDAALSGPEQRILDALAWLHVIGVTEPEQPAVAFLAGYTYGGGAFKNPKGRLRGQGYVEYLAGDRIKLTEAGMARANMPDSALTSAELHRRVLDRLPGPEQRLLRPLLDVYPDSLPNAELAARAGYTPNAGAFNNPRGRLRSLGLIDYPQPGYVVAKSLLFLE